MKRIAAFAAVFLILSVSLSVYAGAASDIQTGSAQSFWGNLNGIYSVSGVSSSSPPYVKLTDDHWVMGTDLNVPDSIQSDMFKAGYFRTVGSTLSGSGSLSFSQSSLSFYLVLSKPVTLSPGQHLEFYIYVGYLNLQNSSYERNIRYVDYVELSNYTPGGNSPSPSVLLTYDNAFYNSGSGDDKVTEYIRFHAYNGTSDSYTFNCLYIRFQTYTGSGGTINPVPAGDYNVSFQSSFSNVVTYYGDGSSVPAPDPILSEINDKIDEQNKLLMQQGQKLDDINDALHNNPYSDEMTVPEAVNPGELVGESEAIGQLEDMADEVDGFLSSLDPTNSLFWRTVIDTLFNASIFTPFIIMAVLFLCVRAVLGR